MSAFALLTLLLPFCISLKVAEDILPRFSSFPGIGTTQMVHQMYLNTTLQRLLSRFEERF